MYTLTLPFPSTFPSQCVKTLVLITLWSPSHKQRTAHAELKLCRGWMGRGVGNRAGIDASMVSVLITSMPTLTDGPIALSTPVLTPARAQPTITTFTITVRHVNTIY
ncbi:hypothetical protein BDQ12DRAFT_725421 [Crucibulum laeve]|uniref:Uncharacterized protein n=1 Tax=Crucibulum laeve TaxID=68775 RepID=A0A5C3LUP6_9AGAR|nr:hypothetical protein BDQ12DRAFT_725421 [Crucibulum laeve]